MAGSDETDLVMLYDEFRNSYEQVNSVTSHYAVMKREEDNLTSKILENDDGGLGTSLSSHAFRRVYDRIEKLLVENPFIYKAVNDSGNTIFRPSNMFMFVTDLILKARLEGNFVKQPNGQYKYVTKVEEWCNDDFSVEFVCYVENNNIKTIFFNNVALKEI